MTLEERLAALEQQVRALQDREEIRSLLERYLWMLASGRIAEIPAALFARNREDASVEYGASGQYIGFKKLSTFYEKDVHPGQFRLAVVGAPQLTLSGDTATGAWTACGVELDAGDLGPHPPADAQARALLSSQTADGAAYACEWIWQRLQVRLCREDGVWKIWQLRVLDLLRAPYDRDFMQFSTARWATDGVRIDACFTSNIPFAPGELPENLANAPTSFHWQYHPHADASELPE